MFVFVCVFCSSSRVSSRMLGQHNLKPALRRANIAPRWANIAPRWTNIASKMSQHSFNMVAKTLKPRVFPWCLRFFFFWGQHTKIGQHMFKMGQHRVKMGQHRAQIGPTWPSRGDTAPNMWANMAPITGPTLPQNGRRPWGEPGGNLGRTLRSMGLWLFCGIFVFVCFFVRLLAFLAPMSGQHSLKPGQHSPKMAQHRAHIANIALRRANITPRWANIWAPRPPTIFPLPPVSAGARLSGVSL